ncbi:MAG: hypothetical protein Q8O67_13520 [Deltaproteobacteria bacterium]|nr:hypothetical protein [Deltaproteobacteria bacterium]
MLHSSTTHRAILLVSIGLFGSAGCQLEKLFPEDVAAGAARLTIRNAALLAKLVDDDIKCGFGSEAVLASPVIEGETGGVGVVTWTVSDCVLQFGDDSGSPKVANSDCTGTDRIVGGKVTINARRIVTGVLTGDAATPVIPLTNDAARIQYEAEVDNYSVRLSSAKTAVTMQTGLLTFDSEIHLAVSSSLGVCGVDTAEVTLKEVTMTDGVYTIDSGDSEFDVDVPSATLTAQLGVWEDKENFIGGSAQVWDTVVDVGALDAVLDPDYEREAFRAGYACKADLLLPQSYECPDLSNTLANGAARLVLNDIGNLVQVAVNDTRCGFASASVVDNARITGSVGYDGGEALYTIETPCLIDIPADTFLSRNCLGEQTKGTGKATIKGSMRQSGRVTGDPGQPIIPTSRDAVEIVFDVAFDGWSVAGDDGKTFIAKTGGATGRMKPRLAKDRSTGACSIPTPVVSFDNVVIKPGTAGSILKDGLQMGVTFQEGSFSALCGEKDGNENQLTGSVVVDTLGATGLAVEVTGDLDPDYDHDLGKAAFACTPNMVVPVSDAECSFDGVIAENAARLTIQTAGTLASMINKDDSCGFEDKLGVLIWPTEVLGDVGDPGSMTWDVLDCSIAHDNLATYSTDCLGGETLVDGTAAFVDVGRTVRGERSTEFLVIDAVIPRERDAVDVNMREVQLTEFTTYAIAAGADEPAGIMIIHQGTLSARVQPALGNRADDTSTYDVPTPVARLSSVKLTGSASLYAQGKTFHFEINDAELLATNGAFLGAENALSGSMSVNGKAFNLGALALNPAYSPSQFDAAYTCTENLAGPVR